MNASSPCRTRVGVPAGHHLLEGAGTHRAEERFSFDEGEFEGVDVRTVKAAESGLGADLFDGRSDLGLLVDRQIVEHDDIGRAERRHEHVLDISENVGLSIGPSKSAVAPRPSSRSAATKA